MKRTFVVMAVLVIALVSAGTVSAHGGDGAESVAVEPAAVDPGTSVTFAGTGLEPESDRVLVLAGGDLVVEFGTVKTDAQGMFSKELDIPAHLPSGTYEIRAIGDETLTATVEVTAVAGGQVAGTADPGAGQVVVSRVRPPWEIVAMLAFVLAVVVAGLVVAWRAERIGRLLQPGGHT